jgi:ADP-ribose pyrophosphatase YjhB (NUDIX family)
METDLSSHGITALVRNGDKYLLLEDCRDETKGLWAPPHGRCEEEDINEEATVIREVKEETGLDVIPVRKVLTQKADTKTNTISFWTVKTVGGEIEIDSGESSNFKWVTIEGALKMNLYPGTRILFNKIVKGEISV